MHSVGHRQPGGLVRRTCPNARVEDTAEPDDETDDAGGVHAGGRGGVLVGRSGMSSVAKHQTRQVRFTS